MHTNELRATIAVVAVILTACGSSNNPGAGSADAGKVPPAADASLGDASPTSGSDAAIDAMTTARHATVPTGSCFSFATGTYDSSNPCTADLYTLAGAKVDLASGSNMNSLCLLTGPYAGLADVPRSYASCAWTSYVEGGNGLANEGLIVAASGGTHHYRVYIESNTLPNLVIDWDAID